MIYPHLDQENDFWGKGFRFVAGIDEAGRGPLAGPVVAGAVVVLPEQVGELSGQKEWTLVRDSKTLSAKQRERAYEFVTQNFLWGAGVIGEKTIDRINILQAAYLAMKKAVTGLKSKCKSDIEMILVDGSHPIPNLSTAQNCIVAGDRHIFSISAASIVAKVTRDRIMLELHEKFPLYGFEKHKGYGTKLHFEMIERHGLSEIHRKSFAKSKINQGAKRPPTEF